jgi:methionine-rich copper-binding protein CopC
MSAVRGLDTEKLRTRRIIATAALTVVAITFLLLSDASTPASAATVTATAPAAGSSNQEVPSDQMSASGMPRSIRPQEE